MRAIQITKYGDSGRLALAPAKHADDIREGRRTKGKLPLSTADTRAAPREDQ